MHAPTEINVKDLDEFVATSGIGVSPNTGEESRDIDVGADDWVEDPFDAEIRYASEIRGEGVEAVDGDGVSRGKTFSTEEF